MHPFTLTEGLIAFGQPRHTLGTSRTGTEQVILPPGSDVRLPGGLLTDRVQTPIYHKDWLRARAMMQVPRGVPFRGDPFWAPCSTSSVEAVHTDAGGRAPPRDRFTGAPCRPQCRIGHDAYRSDLVIGLGDWIGLGNSRSLASVHRPTLLLSQAFLAFPCWARVCLDLALGLGRPIFLSTISGTGKVNFVGFSRRFVSGRPGKAVPLRLLRCTML